MHNFFFSFIVFQSNQSLLFILLLISFWFWLLSIWVL